MKKPSKSAMKCLDVGNGEEEPRSHHYHREGKHNTQSSYDKNWEKWEKFREKKMEMMKVHKYNVEQRLKNENHDRVFYRHHFNYHPVKRPRRKTSLDPNWYTENIYSNQSIDNSDGEAALAIVNTCQTKKPQAYRDINGNLNDELDEIFTLGAQFQRTHNYPKSNSCCFGTNGRNNTRYRIPKSHSFSTSRNMGDGYNMSKAYSRNCFEMVEFPGHALSDSGRLNHYNGLRPLGMRICDREGCFNETCFSKDTKNIHNNNNNIMNEWNQRNRNNMRRRMAAGARQQHVMEEDFDLFEHDEESELNIYNDDSSIVFDEFEDHYGAGQPARDFDELYRHERSKQVLRGKLDRYSKYTDDFTDDYHKSFEDIFNRNCYIDQQQQHHINHNFSSKPCIPKNKSMLEVKPPNKYDDTSSDSTDLELDDFNFDFEKYWEEMEKPSPTSPSELVEKYPPGALKKVKNVNINRYNNGTVIDIYHDDDPYHSDHYHYREGNEKNNNLDFSSPPSITKSRRKVYPSTNNASKGASRHSNSKRNNINSNSNAISFLNNIFSIYKPSKYSPLNCHVEQNYLKNIPAKKMNIASSNRLSGATRSEAENSAKRPLTVHPSKQSISQRSYQTQRSQKDPQAKFQIIPDKTGLKISPLYASSTDYRKARYKMKSTSRPLSFW
ncbi:uncharacterized protein DDB_G0283697-like [Toxorhynchites rutilus septentrionalis]|uniref:uncharacterized protein DDB_G0283697-like n=1 Tax=Toxorhynchites rutilus septentrionalis TaxID=329112 RepID=UPI00247B1586|nr:uncharacterized protein DDB_G0283697-like [Toxorhynchites rutilus septentrionalis]